MTRTLTAPTLEGVNRGSERAQLEMPVESVVYAVAALAVLAMFSLGVF